MSLTLKILPRLSFTLRQMARFYSTPVEYFTEFDFSPKFSPEQQEKVLKTLNESNRDELMNLNVSQTKIRSLLSYKNKRGPFRSLNEILEVDGLGVKLLEKLCEQIISETPSSKSVNNANKRLKNLVVPPITKDYYEIESAVGVHLATTGISWVKLKSKQGEVQCWEYEDFGSLPKKLLPTDTFYLALGILNKLPVADVYIFEGNSSKNPQNQKQPATPYNHQLELMAMLLSLINTSQQHNPKLQDDTLDTVTNRVYFLKPNLPARLFKTLMGNERVSANTTISQLIDSSPSEFTLPCTPILLNEEIKNHYLSQLSPHKDLMGQALMLVITFVDLCIHKNPASITAVSHTRKL